MSALFCGLESLLCLGCARWAYRRCTHTAAADSSAWSPAAAADFAPIPRACRAVLAAYETDLAHPRWAPSPHGYRIPPTSIIRRATYADTAGRCPPYLIYSDNNEVVLAVRGLGLTQNSDYRVLLDNWSGGEPFDGGFVHRGLLGAARWVMEREGEGLVRMVKEMGEEGRLVLAGHSLGAGVAALLAVLIVNELGIERGRVRCYCVAPARCMSLNLAVKYADVIHSVVLQDDFLPRTPTPLEHIFGSMFCLPCLLCGVCVRDTFVSEEKKLKDPRRLYAPGRMYHIIERKSCRCGRFPPEVRTAIPVEGRFEYIILSCNAIFDHSLVWIEREAEKALERMQENLDVSTPPRQQTMEREHSLRKEHADAIQRSEILHLLRPVEPEQGSSEDNDIQRSEILHLLRPVEPEQASSEDNDSATSENQSESISRSSSQSSRRSDWDDELVENLLDKVPLKQNIKDPVQVS